MLGAFLTYSLTIGLGLDYFVALALTIVGSTAAGWLAERLTVRPLKGRHMFTVVLSTLGLSIFLQNGALLVWGPDPREIELGWAACRPRRRRHHFSPPRRARGGSCAHHRADVVHSADAVGHGDARGGRQP